MNGTLEREGRPPFRYNSRGITPQRRDLSAVRVTCWHCGQRGHYSTECPNPPTDRKHEPSAGPSTTMGPTLPTAQPAAPHPKAVAAGHHGGPPSRSNTGPDPTVPRPHNHTHPNQLPVPPTHVATPQLTEQEREPLLHHSSWTPLVPIRQTEPTTRTPFVHSSTAPPIPNPVVVCSVPGSIAYTKHDTPHSRERVFSQQMEISKVVNPIPDTLEIVRQNSTLEGKTPNCHLTSDSLLHPALVHMHFAFSLVAS